MDERGETSEAMRMTLLLEKWNRFAPMSQHELAELMGVHRQRISQIEESAKRKIAIALQKWMREGGQ